MRTKQCIKCGTRCEESVYACPKCKEINFKHGSDEEITNISWDNSTSNKGTGHSTKKKNSVEEDEKSTPESYLKFGKGYNAKKIAISSAQIVDKWGTITQWLWIFSAFCYFVVILSIGHAMGHATIGFFLGLLVGLGVAGLGLVQGALFRMISNYIVASLELK